MNRLSNVTNNGRGGLFATTLEKEELRRGLATPDGVFLSLDGSKIETATQFLMALGEQLRVPDLAEAEDWDYLDESLADLDEFPNAKAVVIFFDQFDRIAEAEPAKWETIMDVFAHAAKVARSGKKGLYVFLRGQKPL